MFAQWASDSLMWFIAALDNLKEFLKLTSPELNKEVQTDNCNILSVKLGTVGGRRCCIKRYFHYYMQ